MNASRKSGVADTIPFNNGSEFKTYLSDRLPSRSPRVEQALRVQLVVDD